MTEEYALLFVQIIKVQQAQFFHSRLSVGMVECFRDCSDGSLLNSYNTLLVSVAAATPHCLTILDVGLDK